MSQGGKFADLGVRVLSAIVLLLALGISFAIGGAAFLIMVSLIFAAMSYELASMHGIKLEFSVGVGVLGGIAMLLHWLVWPWGLHAYLVIVAGLYVIQASRFLLILLPSHILIAFAASAFWIVASQLSPAHMFWLLSCVIASDVAGYVVGRLIGGPKLWPAVSPKKTWSGTIGGWVAAVAVSIGFIPYLPLGMMLLPLAILVAIFAQAGDLSESVLKRRLGVKDASNLIPGHGGFLDRFDGAVGAGLFAMLFFPLISG